MQKIQEDTVTTIKAHNPLGAWLDAKRRSQAALDEYDAFFSSNAHTKRMKAVNTVIHNFFNRNPDYITARANGGDPFHSVKVQSAGKKIARTSQKDKKEKLYGPLDAIGGVTYKVTNGHLIVRVY